MTTILRTVPRTFPPQIDPSIHQPINRSINQSIDQSINPSTINRSIHRSVMRVRRIWLGWVRFIVVYLLYKTNPNPRKIIWCGKKWPKCHFSPNFSRVGLAFGSGVRRFRNNFSSFCNPTEFGKSQPPKSIHPSINTSINYSIHQPINQSINQSNNPSINRLIHHLSTYASSNQSFDQSIDRSFNPSIGLRVPRLMLFVWGLCSQYRPWPSFDKILEIKHTWF